MGKQGPCCHCGVTSTPLWRNGPSEKPILCNACGSRWRTKGTLANYTPLHARAETTDGFDDHRSSRVKTISLKAKELKFPKRKFNENEHNFVSQKSPYDDTSNRSSTGSVISNSFSESCGQFDVGDATDLTDPAQHIVKKRTCVGQPKGSSVERLTRDLCTILHEQRQSKQFSLPYEEDLIFENDTSMVSVEIGHGSMLIRCPSSVAKDEESEASSLSVENKLLTPSYPKSICRVDKVQNEKLKIEGNHNPQLLHVDLNDVVNFDVFTNYLTHEEQQKLLKHLPSLDTSSLPNSLQSMFSSIQFKENIWSFQNLLAEGVLDHSLPGVSAEECRPLKKLVLSNLSKSKWLEQYIILKDAKSKVKYDDPSGVPKQKNDNITKSGNSTISWSTGDNPSHHSGLTMKSSNDHHKEAISNESGLFIAFPLDDSSTMLDSSQLLYDTSEQDLLLDVPFNNAFPEAELLLPAPNFGSKASAICSSSTCPQFLQP